MSTNKSISYLAEMAIFARVVETGSFSAAARQLGVTPSAVSRAVSRLEQALNTRLLERSTRKLRLNESGVEIYQHCCALLASADAVMATTGQFSTTPSGSIRMSVPKAFGFFRVHPVVESFLLTHPSIDVNLRLEDRYMDLIDEDIDVAIRITDPPPAGLIGKRLCAVEHLLCATPAYLKTHGEPKTPADLTQHSCIHLGEEAGDEKWKFQRDGRQVTVAVQGRYASNHSAVRLDAVKAGLGIGGLPSFTAQKALESGDVVAVLPQWRFCTRYSGDAWLLYSSSRYVPAHFRVFIDYITPRLRR